MNLRKPLYAIALFCTPALAFAQTAQPAPEAAPEADAPPPNQTTVGADGVVTALTPGAAAPKRP